MKYFLVKENPQFVGRKSYLERLRKIDARPEASVLVVYGRRRVGKTELIEQFFKDRPILKFEGLQPKEDAIRKGAPAERRRQIARCVLRLGQYVERPDEYRHLTVDSWSDFFALLMPLIATKPVVLYLEELQWLANYSNEFLSEFKPYWDDTLRHNSSLRVVISGSSPSFITNQFLSSSAMYNRSNHMMKLEPFKLCEIKEFLKKGDQETMLAAIAVGGIPEYLKQVRNTASIYIGLCEGSFAPGEFFRAEKKRVFVSSLSSNRFYEGAIDYLAQRKFATRRQIHAALSRKKSKSATPGGSFTQVIDELVELDFVERYVPLTSKNATTSHLARYAIRDEYLQFYFKFIEPRKADIDAGNYAAHPERAISRQDFSKLMGFSFERWCRKNEYLIARCMGFAGVVDYSHGPWYEKSTAGARDAQIDLMFIRKDSKLIVCEIKYNNQSSLSRRVMRDTQDKVDVFLERNPKYARYTVETALISTEPAPAAIRNEGFFTYLIDAAQLFERSNSFGPK